MSNAQTPVLLANQTKVFNHFIPFHKPLIPLSQSFPMWRNIAKQALSRSQSRLLSSQTRTLLAFSQPSTNPTPFRFPVFGFDSGTQCQEMGFRSFRSLSRIGEIPRCFDRGYKSVAEEVCSTDVEEEPEVHLVNKIHREHKRMLQGDSKMEKRKYDSLWKRQVKIETEEWEKATMEYRELLADMCDQKLAPNLPYVKSLFLGWFEPLRNAIAEDQENVRSRKLKKDYGPYLDQLPADKMAVITMHKVMGFLMTSGNAGVVRLVQAASAVGDAIQQEIWISSFQGKTRKKKGDENEEGKEVDENAMKEQDKLRKTVNQMIKKNKISSVRKILGSHDSTKPWISDTKVKVGSHLIHLLIQTAYIQSPANQQDDLPDVRPAFVHALKTLTKEKLKQCGVIECDPLVRKGLEKTGRYTVIPYMPMLVPPLKWTGFRKGAYLFLPSSIMKTHGARRQREALKRVPKAQLQAVFEALNTLGNTKWRVNKRILTVVDRIWSSGGGIADLVDRSDVPLPEKPDTEDEIILKKWKWEFRSAKKENSERHSQRCDTELKLSVARKMKEEEGFYYPHNIDFRGRAYPMPPHLNHLGSDLCRGILEFAEGRPLGSSGIYWLKIHLANLYAGGVDKLSYEGRLAFTENHLDDIFDSADRPLEGDRWWLQAEDPFQCLAVCINLTEALRSPSPESVLSHIHVHQDGSCNGLQHYAALGRDTLGAEAVNLVAGEKPADVYSGIATRVLDIMRVDAARDPEVFPNALRAKKLISEVDRKLVKQTVMTSVYGVTYVGARDQILKRLKERGAFSDDDKELFGIACYVAKVTLAAIDEMFEAARAIMSWFSECAKIITSENETVRWTTPLGLPVVQPYQEKGRHHVKTALQNLTIQHELDKVLVRRQRTAFPPNFVHSLDGCHMMMTALACKSEGLCFAGVHDSFWTHACDVDILNKKLREKFVELYSQPILEDLLESFQKSFPQLQFPPLPERGDLDLNAVLDSPYFFN